MRLDLSGGGARRGHQLTHQEPALQGSSLLAVRLCHAGLQGASDAQDAHTMDLGPHLGEAECTRKVPT